MWHETNFVSNFVHEQHMNFIKTKNKVLLCCKLFLLVFICSSLWPHVLPLELNPLPFFSHLPLGLIFLRKVNNKVIMLGKCETKGWEEHLEPLPNSITWWLKNPLFPSLLLWSSSSSWRFCFNDFRSSPPSPPLDGDHLDLLMFLFKLTHPPTTKTLRP